MQPRIMLVENRADLRHLMAALLGREPDLDVVAQAGSLAEARRRAASLRLDVAVLDLGLADGSGSFSVAGSEGLPGYHAETSYR